MKKSEANVEYNNSRVKLHGKLLESGKLPKPDVVVSRGTKRHAVQTLGAVSVAGSLLDRPESAKSRNEELRIPLSANDLARQGYAIDSYAAGILSSDGFSVRKHNWRSRQDAAAVNLNARRFAVSDGMGGYGFDKLGTAWFAQYLATFAVKYGIDALLEPGGAQTAVRDSEAVFREVHARKMIAPSAMIRGVNIGAVGATLTFAEVLTASKVRIVCVGDSPAFLLSDESVMYGEDAQTGRTDTPLRNFYGLDNDLQVVVPKPGTDAMGRCLVDITVDLKENQLLAIGTDYFSETDPRRFISTDAESFADLVESDGKLDDATLILVDPQRLPSS